MSNQRDTKRAMIEVLRDYDDYNEGRNKERLLKIDRFALHLLMFFGSVVFATSLVAMISPSGWVSMHYTANVLVWSVVCSISILMVVFGFYLSIIRHFDIVRHVKDIETRHTRWLLNKKHRDMEDL